MRKSQVVLYQSGCILDSLLLYLNISKKGEEGKGRGGGLNREWQESLWEIFFVVLYQSYCLFMYFGLFPILVFKKMGWKGRQWGAGEMTEITNMGESPSIIKRGEKGEREWKGMNKGEFL